MNRHAKRISNSCRPEIERTKGYIRNSNGKWFDGSGYIFKVALREMRESGYVIKYNRKKCSYHVVSTP